MAEVQLRKLESERDRLQAENKLLTESTTTREACDDLVRYVEKATEPFSADEQKSNPWVANNTGGGGCCAVQ